MVFWLAAEVLEEALLPELFDLIPILNLAVLHDVGVRVKDLVCDGLVADVKVKVLCALHLSGRCVLQVAVSNLRWDNKIGARVGGIAHLSVASSDVDDHRRCRVCGHSKVGLSVKIVKNREMSSMILSSVKRCDVSSDICCLSLT